MLSNANLPNIFQAEVASTTIYLINRSPSTTIELKTHMERQSGYAPNLINLRIFGSVDYASIDQGKMEPRALKCMLLGYLEGDKGFRLWYNDKGKSKIIISMYVVFRENEMYYPHDRMVINNLLKMRNLCLRWIHLKFPLVIRRKL